MRTFKLLVGATFTLVSLISSQGRAAEPGGGNDYPAAANPGTDDAAMAQWKRRGEARDWMAEELAKHKVVIPTDNKGLIGKGQGSTYGSVTPEDVNVWQQETYKLAVEGSRIFHSGDRLKSTIAVSCDMCHPDGANTHPRLTRNFRPSSGESRCCETRSTGASKIRCGAKSLVRIPPRCARWRPISMPSARACLCSTESARKCQAISSPCSPMAHGRKPL